MTSWPEGGPPLIWKATGLGKGYSSVSVADGMIFTAGMSDLQTEVVALDLDGKEVWRRPNGQSWQTTKRYAMAYAGSRGTPTYDEGVLYHLGELGSLTAFDAKTGREVWKVDLFKRFDAGTPKYGIAESVLIDGDRLYCCPAGTKGFLVCLEKGTGSLVWANTEIPGSAGYSSCQIIDWKGVRQVVGMSSDGPFSVNAETGKLLWTASHRNPRDNNATDPLFRDGYVFVSSGYGLGSALLRMTPALGPDNIAKRMDVATVYTTKLLDNHHGGVFLLDGKVYGAGHQAKGWFCLDFLTGKPQWTAPGKGSLTYAEGHLYLLGERGKASLVRATPEAFREVSSFVVPKGGQGPYWAHPVVCGGRLYVRHADTLFAFDIKAKQ